MLQRRPYGQNPVAMQQGQQDPFGGGVIGRIASKDARKMGQTHTGIARAE